MDKNSKIFVAGHRGLVGSAIARKLKEDGYNNVIFASRSKFDFTNYGQTLYYFSKYQPEYVFVAAAKVGGILANSNYPAEFIYDNVMIAINIIQASYLTGVSKLVYFGSSCVYPKFAPQPIIESSLLTGPLEPTNDSYAIAKITGIMACRAYNKQFGTNYISVMPTNLYGPNDSYDLDNCHVLPALIRKFHAAKVNNEPTVEIWGSGSPLREFLFVDDLATASVRVMKNFNVTNKLSTDVGNGVINIGSGEEITIKNLAIMIKDIVGYKGEIVFDETKPDGTPRKAIDSGKMNLLGWKAQVPLATGIMVAYDDFVKREWPKIAFETAFGKTDKSIINTEATLCLEE